MVGTVVDGKQVVEVGTGETRRGGLEKELEGVRTCGDGTDTRAW